MGQDEYGRKEKSERGNSNSTLWDSVYSSDNSFFGDEPSILARESLPFLEGHRCKTILELGCGQGRDAVFFARNGFRVHAFDLSDVAVSQLKENIARLALESRVTVAQADLSKELQSRPSLLEGGQFGIDAVYSHLFLCMPFNDEELRRIFDLTFGILQKGGLHIFSIRNKNKDKGYGMGREVGKDTFEINNFRVRFYDMDEILSYNKRFKVLKSSESYEAPCSLILVFSVKQD